MLYIFHSDSCVPDYPITLDICSSNESLYNFAIPVHPETQLTGAEAGAAASGNAF